MKRETARGKISDLILNIMYRRSENDLLKLPAGILLEAICITFCEDKSQLQSRNGTISEAASFLLSAVTHDVPAGSSLPNDAK